MIPNFKLNEFKCKCCGEYPVDTGLLHRLQVLRDILQVPIHITSGYRCERYNKAIGGAVDSYHVKGEAADWTCSKMSEAVRLCENWSGGFHYYKDKNFIHTDVGPKRRW